VHTRIEIVAAKRVGIKMDKNNLNISKEPWLAVTLSMFLAGVGQIYSGKIRRGCILICFEITLYCYALWFLLSFTGNIKIGVGLFLALGAIRIWNLFDAHACAKKANTEDFEISRKESKDPWLAVFLSDLLPGLGQIYIKKWSLGIMFIACCGLWAVFSAFVCYHAYISSPVRREASKKLIAIIAVAIFGWELLRYTAIPFQEYFVEAFKMTTCPMEPTLIPGDRILVRKSGKYSPKRGDIVVFKSPRDPNIPYVMRVVGLGGESVEIRDKNIYINDKESECPSLQNIGYVSIGKQGVEGKPFIVPNNSLFVLGDNSNHSMDSRFYGSIPEADLIGKAYKIYWPPNRMGPIE